MAVHPRPGPGKPSVPVASAERFPSQGVAVLRGGTGIRFLAVHHPDVSGVERMWVRRGAHVMSALPPLARRSTRVSGPPVRRGSRLRLEEAGMKVSRIVTAGVAALAGCGVLCTAPSAVQAGPTSVPAWTKQAPASHPPARDAASMAYDTATGTAVLYGGISSSGTP